MIWAADWSWGWEQNLRTEIQMSIWAKMCVGTKCLRLNRNMSMIAMHVERPASLANVHFSNDGERPFNVNPGGRVQDAHGFTQCAKSRWRQRVTHCYQNSWFAESSVSYYAIEPNVRGYSGRRAIKPIHSEGHVGYHITNQQLQSVH